MRRRVFLLGISGLFGIGLGYVGAKLELVERFVQPAVALQPDFGISPGGYGAQKVIYHITEKGHWRNRDGEASRLVHVLNNHRRAVEPDDFEAQVLFQGNGVDLLRRAKKNPVLAAQFDDLRRKGVKFRVCANTLSAYGMPLESLHNVAKDDLVFAAVAEIVHLQKEGWGYIRF
ncbi:MAG: DsrE family protein [Rhizobiales bacterium]|jgi:intracellular sulfur oxidation DsrE/DsrF family protein|nr:DsrE family protein [Hyphomicrobiales bacterium]